MTQAGVETSTRGDPPTPRGITAGTAPKGKGRNTARRGPVTASGVMGKTGVKRVAMVLLIEVR